MNDQKFPLSVVVITKNEEDNIAKCLDSTKWADEIIVVDDHSTDNTVSIAKNYTDKVFVKKMDVEGTHRNYAYSLANNTWVLSIDADEVISEELKNEIIDTLNKNTEHNVFAIPLRNYIGNYWIRWGGWYPAFKDRLFRKDHFKYEDVDVHPRVFYDGTCGRLSKDIIHYSYKDFGEFVRSLDGQTTKEAQKWYSTKKKVTFFKAMWRTIDRFIRTYYTKKGYKDGYVGLFIAACGGMYQFLSYAKYWEIKRNDKNR